jgi:hypothetical protein
LRTWNFDYSQDPAWTGKLRCTEVTMKCGEDYKEPSQSLLDSHYAQVLQEEQRAKPKYSECVCDNIDRNANFASLSRTFVLLIR